MEDLWKIDGKRMENCKICIGFVLKNFFQNSFQLYVLIGNIFLSFLLEGTKKPAKCGFLRVFLRTTIRFEMLVLLICLNNPNSFEAFLDVHQGSYELLAGCMPI